MRWRNRILLVLILAAVFGACGLITSNGPFWPELEWRVAVGGVVVGSVLGVLIVLAEKRRAGPRDDGEGDGG